MPFPRYKLGIFLLLWIPLFHRPKVKQRKHEVKWSSAWPLSKSNKTGQEQLSHPSISWGSSVLPVQVWLLSLIQQTAGMGTCNKYGCSDSYSEDFTVWKQNTCELNEPCGGWNDIDGKCGYFTKFEEGKLDKVCKKQVQIIYLCMKQVWFQQQECNFFPVRTADLGRRDLEGEKKRLWLLLSVLRVFSASFNTIQKKQILPWWNSLFSNLNIIFSLVREKKSLLL